MTPRRRGAQPRNTNALKHGFYSRQFREIELADLTGLAAGLDGEIASLRVWARRLQETADLEDLDIETGIKVLAGLGVAFSKVAALMRTNAILAGSNTELEGILTTALEQVWKELTCPAKNAKPPAK